MLLLWILLAVLLLLALLCAARVGVWAAYSGGDLLLDVKIGFLRLHILPARPASHKREKSKKVKKRPAKEAKKKPEKPRRPITFEDIRDAFHTLLPPLKRGLKRMGKGVRIHPLRLSLVLGGQEDPAAAARLQGQAQTLLWSGMPLLESLMDIPAPSVHTDVDFTAAAPVIEGEMGVTFRIGTLLAAGFGVAFPALRWFLRFRKRLKTRPPEPGETEKPMKEPAA